MEADKFVREAAISGMFEIESSTLALEEAESESVRGFAQEMIDDHGKANDALKRLAEKEGLPVPSDLDDAHQKKMEKLKDADGGFDKTYVTEQEEGHDEAINLFEQYLANGGNEALKRFARDTLPVLKKHREHIEALMATD